MVRDKRSRDRSEDRRRVCGVHGHRDHQQARHRADQGANWIAFARSRICPTWWRRWCACISVGIGVLFNFGARADAKDSNRTIAGLSQGGLSLPDREYYLEDGRQERRDPPAIRRAHGEDVPTGGRFRRDRRGECETRDRDGDDSGEGCHGSRVDARSQQDLSHHDEAAACRTGAELRLGGVFPRHWRARLRYAECRPARHLQADVGGPGGFAERFVARLLHVSSAAASAPDLPEAFENETFDFWSRYLSGTKEPRPRRRAVWRRWTGNWATCWDSGTSN